MAYETLKGVIRQYIKTNGNNEITGQILQNVLIEMVDNYPSLAGYATQNWVWNTALSGYATQTYVQNNRLKARSYVSDSWQNTGILRGVKIANGLTVEVVPGESNLYDLKTDVNYFDNRYLQPSALSGYATQTWVGLNYLPLSGGNLTGSLSILDTLTLSASSLRWVDEGEWSELYFDMDGITVTAFGTGYVIASQFIVPNGTDSQFLKADGSVDSNAYITSAALSGYATESWVTNQGYITSSALSGYATQQWVGNNYMPLTGSDYIEMPTSSNSAAFIFYGTYNGNRYMTGGVAFDGDNGTIDMFADYGISLCNGNFVVYRSNYIEANVSMVVHGSVTASSFINNSDERLKNIIGDAALTLEQVAQAPAVRFSFKKDKDNKQRVGTIAQYWQPLLPEVVHGTDTLGLDYPSLATVCAISIAREVRELKKEIAELRQQIMSN